MSGLINYCRRCGLKSYFIMKKNLVIAIMMILFMLLLVACAGKEEEGDKKAKEETRESITNDLSDEKVNVENSINDTNDDEMNVENVLESSDAGENEEKTKEEKDLETLQYVYDVFINAFKEPQIYSDLKEWFSEMEIWTGGYSLEETLDMMRDEEMFSNLLAYLEENLGEIPEFEAKCNENACMAILWGPNNEIMVISILYDDPIFCNEIFDDNDERRFMAVGKPECISLLWGM